MSIKNSAVKKIEVLLGIITPLERQLIGRAFNCESQAGNGNGITQTWRDTYEILGFTLENVHERVSPLPLRFIELGCKVKGGTIKYSAKVLADELAGDTWRSSGKTRDLLVEWVRENT